MWVYVYQIDALSTEPSITSNSNIKSRAGESIIEKLTQECVHACVHVYVCVCVHACVCAYACVGARMCMCVSAVVGGAGGREEDSGKKLLDLGVGHPPLSTWKLGISSFSLCGWVSRGIERLRYFPGAAQRLSDKIIRLSPSSLMTVPICPSA